MWIDRRLLVAVGGLSLLLNVFLVGLVVGQGYGRLHRAPAAGPGGAARIGASQGGAGQGGTGQGGTGQGGTGQTGAGPVVHQGHMRLLSPEERRLFQAAMRPYRPAIRTAREAVRARRQVVEAALAAPDYDRDAVVAGFAALRAAEGEVAAKLHAGLAEAMAALPQPARAALVAHDRPRGDDGKPEGGRTEAGTPGGEAVAGSGKPAAAGAPGAPGAADGNPAPRGPAGTR